jgi:hypothetical protein
MRAAIRRACYLIDVRNRTDTGAKRGADVSGAIQRRALAIRHCGYAGRG